MLFFAIIILDKSTWHTLLTFSFVSALIRLSYLYSILSAKPLFLTFSYLSCEVSHSPCLPTLSSPTPFKKFSQLTVIDTEKNNTEQNTLHVALIF
jgi:hypothetical protein